jgi:hypothetical protein
LQRRNDPPVGLAEPMPAEIHDDVAVETGENMGEKEHGMVEEVEAVRRLRGEAANGLELPRWYFFLIRSHGIVSREAMIIDVRAGTCIDTCFTSGPALNRREYFVMSSRAISGQV